MVKGCRESTFGYKINLSTRTSSLIIDCRIFDGNLGDTQAYGGVIDPIKRNYGVVSCVVRCVRNRRKMQSKLTDAYHEWHENMKTDGSFCRLLVFSVLARFKSSIKIQTQNNCSMKELRK